MEEFSFKSGFFYQLIGCPKKNFKPLTRRQPHLPGIHYWAISNLTQRPSRTLTRLGPKPWQSASAEFEPGTFYTPHILWINTVLHQGLSSCILNLAYQSNRSSYMTLKVVSATCLFLKLKREHL